MVLTWISQQLQMNPNQNSFTAKKIFLFKFRTLLSLSNNNLIDLPDSFYNLINLSYLNLTNNNFIGPVSIFNKLKKELVSLESINLGDVFSDVFA